jgi:Ca-activated chloride channel homolog
LLTRKAQNYRMRACRLLTGLLLSLAAPLSACETALLLAIDVSNSVDEAEYRLQIDGLADALSDPEVADIIVGSQAALLVMQWSGTDRQEISLPWTRLTTPAAVAEFALATRLVPRAFRLSDTAPAEAMRFALDQFADVGDCERHVIDVSGDGTPNAGGDTRLAQREAERQGVTINGIAIESMGLAITGFYRRGIATTDGFVMTARGHREYPQAIREKLIRELARIVG